MNSLKFCQTGFAIYLILIFVIQKGNCQRCNVDITSGQPFNNASVSKFTVGAGNFGCPTGTVNWAYPAGYLKGNFMCGLCAHSPQPLNFKVCLFTTDIFKQGGKAFDNTTGTMIPMQGEGSCTSIKSGTETPAAKLVFSAPPNWFFLTNIYYNIPISPGHGMSI